MPTSAQETSSAPATLANIIHQRLENRKRISGFKRNELNTSKNKNGNIQIKELFMTDINKLQILGQMSLKIINNLLCGSFLLCQYVQGQLRRFFAVYLNKEKIINKYR